MLPYSLQAIQKADLWGHSMNYLFIGLLEPFFMKELRSHSYDGGKKKRIFEVYKQYKMKLF